MRKRDDGETEVRMIGVSVRLDGIVVVVTGRSEEGSPLDSESGDGVVKDSKNGICLVAASVGTLQVTGEMRVRPMSTANGAIETSMADIGGDAGEMESMGALCGEDGLPRTAAAAVVCSVA